MLLFVGVVPDAVLVVPLDAAPGVALGAALEVALGCASSLAAASIAIRCLTQRMNPLIRPLMDSIRFESNQDLQSL